MPSWGLLEVCALRGRPSERDWHSGKSGSKSAYKNLAARKYAPIATRWPGNATFRAPLPTTHLFGATGSVLRYNVSSRAAVAIFVRFLYTQDRGDFGFLITRGASVYDVTVSAESCAIFWITPMGERHFSGPINAFLGLTGSPHNRGNQFSFSTPSPPYILPKRKEILDQIARGRSATHSAMGSFIVRLGCAQINSPTGARAACSSRFTGSYSDVRSIPIYTGKHWAIPNGGQRL